MHFEMTFTCVLMKSKVSKLVFYLLCALGIGQLEWTGALGKLVYPIFRRFPIRQWTSQKAA